MIYQSEIVSHLLITFVYFFLVSVLRWKLDFNLFWLWLGAAVGTFFLDIDHLVYWLVTDPEKEDSKEARETIRRSTTSTTGITSITGRLRELYVLLKRVHFTHTRLIFHSALGQIILLILAFYLLTSGGSVFGSAFIMAMNLHLLKDEWVDYQKDKGHLADWLFWQIKDEGIKSYTREYLIGASLIFLGLTRFIL